jgi:hypothetical protein
VSGIAVGSGTGVRVGGTGVSVGTSVGVSVGRRVETVVGGAAAGTAVDVGEGTTAGRSCRRPTKMKMLSTPRTKNAQSGILRVGFIDPVG